MLFAQNGFEATSTATIAREAGSSESQLIRYFGGKAGLLETIFNEAWSALNDSVAQHVNEAEHGRDALIARGVQDGSFRNDIDPKVISAAMLGCAEGMIRDRVLAERNNQPSPFDDEMIVRTFTAMVNGLAPAG